MMSEQVVQQGVRGLERGKSLIIPGWFNWTSSLLVGISPGFLTRKIAALGMGQNKSEMAQDQEPVALPAWYNS